MKNIAVVGAGIVGICSAYFLKKSGFQVTLIDKEKPGTMTSFGHACSFADYANVPVNYPGLLWDIPSMLLRKDGPLAVDFFYIIKNLPWAINFLKNCRKEKVDEIATSLTNLLKHSQLSYDEIFKDVNVKEFISHEENLYLFDTKKSFENYEYANIIRKNNNVKVRNLNKDEVKELEPNIADVYHSGQVFTGSRHTTNPLAISNKIFDKFIELEKTQSEILGMFSLIICLAIIFTHNIWTGPWEIFVSVIGWLGLLKGIGRLGIIPVYSKYRLKKMESNSSKKSAWFTIIFGLIMLYGGFTF